MVYYPGLFAPASLKQDNADKWKELSDILSGAFCPGLIEAPLGVVDGRLWWQNYPGLFAPASLKLTASSRSTVRRLIIRGFLPRPH